MDEAALAALDGAGYTVLEALVHIRRATKPSAHTPELFACMDGKNYWIKRAAQQGLVAELVAGRLAVLAGAGPDARIVNVTPEVLTGSGASNDFGGIKVGVLDIPDAVNCRDLDTIGLTAVDPKLISAEDRARVVVFQTWIGANDGQVLLEMTNGRVWSIDHGDVFGATAPNVDPAPVVTAVSGLPANHGCETGLVTAAMSRVESIGDDAILASVAAVPMGAEWRAQRSRRLEIAKWLAYRRGRLREGMKTWR